MAGLFQTVRSARPGRSVFNLSYEKNLPLIWVSSFPLCATKLFRVTNGRSETK